MRASFFLVAAALMAVLAPSAFAGDLLPTTLVGRVVVDAGVCEARVGVEILPTTGSQVVISLAESYDPLVRLCTAVGGNAFAGTGDRATGWSGQSVLPVGHRYDVTLQPLGGGNYRFHEEAPTLGYTLDGIVSIVT